MSCHYIKTVLLIHLNIWQAFNLALYKAERTPHLLKISNNIYHNIFLLGTEPSKAYYETGHTLGHTLGLTKPHFGTYSAILLDILRQALGHT